VQRVGWDGGWGWVGVVTTCGMCLYVVGGAGGLFALVQWCETICDALFLFVYVCLLTCALNHGAALRL